MARILTHADLLHTPPSGILQHWAYNTLDCTTTRGVWDTLHPRLNSVTGRTYYYELGMQAPAFAMMSRGVLVNEKERQAAIKLLMDEAVAETAACNAFLDGTADRGPLWDKTEKDTGSCPTPKRKDGKHSWPRSGKKSGEQPTPELTLEKMHCEACGSARLKRRPFNPMSDEDVKHLLHDLLGVPVMQNKKGADSVDKEVRERIGRKYPKAAWAVLWINKIRRLRDQASVLASTVSADGRMRSTFGVGVADTGRWSSAANPLGEGTNLQNIEGRLRHIFRAEPGRLMFYADLEQAESCCVAYLAQDEAYIEAHKSGDVHTYVCRMIWPNELPWNGDLAKDKKIASTTNPPWDPEHDYRYNSKRIQHGSNYLLTGIGLARLARIPQKVGCAVQEVYFDAFPGIPVWQTGIVNQVRNYGFVTTPLGRRRQLFGRPWEDHTWKQAVAQVPQSMVADILACGLWRAWSEMDPAEVWMLAQIHDALLGTVEGAYGSATSKEVIDRLLAHMLVPVDMPGGRQMTIAVDTQVGYNWGKKSDTNLEGMRGLW